MFDQLYVLARGGVCIYADHPSKIQSHLFNVEKNFPLSKTLINQKQSFPLEKLITYSCQSFEDNAIVQKLSYHVNHHQLMIIGDGNDLIDNNVYVQLITDGVQRNRRRFSFYSTLILIQRYFHYIKGYLWFSMLFYIVAYLTFAYVLVKVFDPQIATSSGCVSLEDDYAIIADIITTSSSSCAPKTNEKMFNFKQVINNYRYSYFATSVCLFNMVLNCALQFAQDFIYLKNEHLNGLFVC